VTGYASQVGFFGHSAAESNEDLMALIGTTEVFEGPGLLLPIRNAELFRWCLGEGLRVVMPMTLMSRGRYREPQGVYLPAVIY
jgi:hypothetical protein